MLACAHPAFDGPVILFQNIIEVLHRSMSASRYRLLIQIELEKYLGPFNTLRFGESKPFVGLVTTVGLTFFFTTEIPDLKKGSPFPLSTNSVSEPLTLLSDFILLGALSKISFTIRRAILPYDFVILE